MKIKLTYDTGRDQLTIDPHEIVLKRGDTLEFHSDQGPVNILLSPAELYSKSEYHTGDDPIQVVQAGNGQFWCGVVISGVTWGFPEHRRFGSHTVQT